jgi:hypothetical protein
MRRIEHRRNAALGLADLAVIRNEAERATLLNLSFWQLR